MNWLNLRTESLRSPDVAQATHEALATWLRVLTFACEQENGGRLAGAAKWNDRAWMVTCGVTALEVAGATPLLSRDGDDILVSMYPMEKQEEVQKDRVNGRKGGSSTSQAKAEAARRNGSQAKAKGGLGSLPNGKEGKDKGIGKEGERKESVVDDDCGPRPGEGPPKDLWISSCARHSIPAWYAENKFHVWEAKGWAMGKTPVVWKKCVPLAAQDFQNDGRPMTPEAAKPKNGNTTQRTTADRERDRTGIAGDNIPIKLIGSRDVQDRGGG